MLLLLAAVFYIHHRRKSREETDQTEPILGKEMKDQQRRDEITSDLRSTDSQLSELEERLSGLEGEERQKADARQRQLLQHKLKRERELHELERGEAARQVDTATRLARQNSMERHDAEAQAEDERRKREAAEQAARDLESDLKRREAEAARREAEVTRRRAEEQAKYDREVATLQREKAALAARAQEVGQREDSMQRKGGGAWVWECCLGGDTWQEYPEELVRTFETNHAAKVLTFTFSRKGTRYAADLTDSTHMVQRRDDGQFSTERPIRRRLKPAQLAAGSWQNVVPHEWDAPDAASLKVPRAVELADGPEKAKVVRIFNASLGGKPKRVVRVERVQNWTQWHSYFLKLDQAVGREEREAEATDRAPLTRSDIEREDLFHGTSETVAGKIVDGFFDRNYAGSTVGHLYGHGSYFATTSKYSVEYSWPDAYGHQRMFLCRVIVGRYCKGKKDMKNPILDGDPTRYDTTVDDVSNPKIFVTYHDSDAYPTHLVTFE